MSATLNGSSQPEALDQRVRRVLASCNDTARTARVGSVRRARLRMHLQVARERRATVIEASRSASLERRREQAGLTPRQHEILLLVAEGLATKQIARRLWLSPATVSNHVAAILIALDAHSRLEAVSTAHRLGLLEARHTRP
jgi:DNA-binding NarL/FixJ family response regulator